MINFNGKSAARYQAVAHLQFSHPTITFLLLSIYFKASKMEIVSKIFIGLVSLMHLYTLYIEMFAWETKGRKAFRDAIPPEGFTPSRNLASNLGLYNGFIAAGLIWTLLITDVEWQTNIAIFFLSFVVIAGIYGGVTGSEKVFFFQALPAIIALTLTFFK